MNRMVSGHVSIALSQFPGGQLESVVHLSLAEFNPPVLRSASLLEHPVLP